MPHNDYTPHSFTVRGIDELEYLYKSEKLDFYKYLASISYGMILDFGCGSGHAILQIQERFPEMNTYCVNKGGYGKSQSEKSQDLIDASYYFKIKLPCTINGDIILPHIILTPGLAQDQSLDLNFHEKFDFIYSMHALNEGKIEITQSHIWLDKLIPLLKHSMIRGSRMILILNKFDFNFIYASNNNNTTNSIEKKNHKIHTWQYYENKSYIYVTLYTVILKEYNASYFCVSVVKCKNAFCRSIVGHNLIHIINSDPTDTINIIRTLKINKYGTGTINNNKNPDESTNVFRDRYSVEYVWNLLEHLDMKEKMFPVPSQ